jgi:hypothetical protein
MNKNGGLGGLGGMSSPAQPDINAIFMQLFGRPADPGAMQHYGAMQDPNMRDTIALGAWNSGQDRGMMLQNDPAAYQRAWLERASRDQNRIMGMPFVSGPNNPTTMTAIPGLEALLNKTAANAQPAPQMAQQQQPMPEENRGNWYNR